VTEVSDFAFEPVKEQYLSDQEKAAATQKQGRDKYLSVDERIGIKLKTENRAFQVQKFEHPYPHCWRTDKPVLYYPLDSWFIRTTAVKDKLVALNKQINWKPESTGSGRFGNWLENLVDWNLSRSRYWGTPLPVWVNDEDATEIDVIGSYADLAARIGRPLPDDFDPHKPHIDQYTWPAPSGTGTMRRVPEVIDTWFDSGSMPFAQWHYPFENHDKVEAQFPADFICEGVDQTRGWFYSLLAIATGLGGRIAVIDTERGSASKYAGLFSFDALELATFSPRTYVEAVAAADALLPSFGAAVADAQKLGETYALHLASNPKNALRAVTVPAASFTVRTKSMRPSPSTSARLTSPVAALATRAAAKLAAPSVLVDLRMTTEPLAAPRLLVRTHTRSARPSPSTSTACNASWKVAL
jgi:hypothetical protein